MPAQRQPIPFGIFEVDLASGELRRNGVRVHLQEQPFQVLAALLESPGEIVTKQELQERLWKDDTFVDFDRSLATAINKVRQALGDSATSPRFIETVPKRGYRFIGPGAVRHGSFPRTSTTRQRLLWAAFAIGLIAVTAGLYAGLWKPQPETVFKPMEAVPFTTDRGLVGKPTFSPDGTYVAYDWSGEDQSNWDIYVKLVGPGEPLRITTNDASDYAYSPSWSPDGTRIAFFRGNPVRGKVGVYIIPALGGRERKLAEIHQSALAMQVGTCLDWSPDSLWLAVCDGPSPTGPFRLFLLSVGTSELRQLTTPAADGSPKSDITPAFSPDGRMIAFARGGPAPVLEIYLLDLGDDFTPQGDPRPLTALGTLARGPVFPPMATTSFLVPAFPATFGECLYLAMHRPNECRS